MTPDGPDLACCLVANSTSLCSVDRSEDCLANAGLPLPAEICCALPVTDDACTGNECDTGLPGVCRLGTYECADGGLECVEAAFPEAETCDGIDNDCDGLTDEECTFDATVDGRANIFGGGHSTLPGGGVAPPGVALNAAPGSVVVFSSVAGAVTGWSRGCAFNGPDGGQVCGASTDVASAMGISGIVHTDRTMFLTGVFLGTAEPSDLAPSRLTFSSTDDFTDLWPELDQTFFIGDGQGVEGDTQRFHIPDGATRLYLGFAETFQFSTGGAPGAYDDNGGSLTVTLSVTVP